MSEPRNALGKRITTIFKGIDMPEEVASSGLIKPMIYTADPGVHPINRKEEVPVVQKATPIYPVKDHHIETLMRSVKCTKDHICYHSGYRTLCKARSLLGGHLIECLERDQHCAFRFTFLCRCVIRRYIAGKLGR
jgi:hypothetical protein